MFNSATQLQLRHSVVPWVQNAPLVLQLLQPHDGVPMNLAGADHKLFVSICVTPKNPFKNVVQPLLLATPQCQKRSLFVEMNVLVILDDMAFSSHFVNQQPLPIVRSHSKQSSLGNGLALVRKQAWIRRLSHEPWRIPGDCLVWDFVLLCACEMLFELTTSLNCWLSVWDCVNRKAQSSSFSWIRN